MNFDIDEYENKGFFLLEKLFNKDESNDLKKYARKRLLSNSDKASILQKKDKNGKVTLLSNWSTTLNSDVLCLIALDNDTSLLSRAIKLKTSLLSVVLQLLNNVTFPFLSFFCKILALSELDKSLFLAYFFKSFDSSLLNSFSNKKKPLFSYSSISKFIFFNFYLS
jgi:hypothetical protein